MVECPNFAARDKVAAQLLAVDHNILKVHAILYDFMTIMDHESDYVLRSNKQFQMDCMAIMDHEFEYVLRSNNLFLNGLYANY